MPEPFNCPDCGDYKFNASYTSDEYGRQDVTCGECSWRGKYDLNAVDKQAAELRPRLAKQYGLSEEDIQSIWDAFETLPGYAPEDE